MLQTLQHACVERIVLQELQKTAMSLARRILLAQLAPLAILVVLGVLAVLLIVMQMRLQDVSLHELHDVALSDEAIKPLAVAAGRLSAQNEEESDADADAMLRLGESDLDEALPLIKELVDRHEGEGDEDDQGEGEEDERETLLTALSSAAEARELLASDQTTARRLLLRSIAALQTYNAQAEAEAAEALSDARHLARLSIWGFAGLFGVAVAAGGWMGLRFYNSIRRSLAELQSGARRVAAGDFDRPVPLPPEGELAALAHDFNTMARHLSQVYGDLERRVAQTSRELVDAERLVSVGYLAAGVAHEVNNPLGVIVGFCDLLLRKLDAGDPTQEPTHERIAAIREEAMRCSKIASRLVSLARPGGGTREQVDLNRVAESTLDLAKVHTLAKRRELLFEPADQPLWVMANVDELRQVILNLLLNALAAVPAGSGRVLVRLAEVQRSPGPRGPEACLQVVDNGRGMTAPQLARAFEPFYTLRPAADELTHRNGDVQVPRHGAGLGLTISRGLVEQQDGRLDADSDGPGKGSTFSLTLPRYDGNPLAKPNTPEAADVP